MKTIEELQGEYTKLCAQLGEISFKQEQLKQQEMQLKNQLLLIAQEADRIKLIQQEVEKVAQQDKTATQES
jgi:hypothetical protein